MTNQQRTKEDLDKIEAVIVDDDPHARDLLQALLERLPGVRVVGGAATIPAAQRALTETGYDVVFLDVQLLGGSGFDLVPFVRADAAIVFVTGHDHHAVRAFEVNAVDYIVKPVTAARLGEALRRLGHRAAGDRESRRFRTADSIFLRGAAAGGKFVAVRDIVAILSSENYAEVVLSNGQRWCVRRTMDAWAAMLPEELFLRVHRTALVNLTAIERVERAPNAPTALFLRGMRRTVPVSRSHWLRLRTRLSS